MVAVLGSGLTVSALGRSRIAPYNWSFLTDLWDQIAFWARSLVFILASILVPRLLGDVGLHDLMLVAVLVVAAFAARILVLFVLVPPLEFFKLTQPISSGIQAGDHLGRAAWRADPGAGSGGDRECGLSPEMKRFIAVLATGLVLFTLFVNGTTLRSVIDLLGLNRLSPRNQVLRDQVLALSYAEVCDSVRDMARDHALAESAVEEVVKPYQAWIEAANARDADERLTDRDRLAIALAALANQERVLGSPRRAPIGSRHRPRCRCCCEMGMRWSRALEPKAASDTAELPKRRSRSLSHSASPISSTDISGSCGFSPIAWRPRRAAVGHAAIGRQVTGL